MVLGDIGPHAVEQHVAALGGHGYWIVGAGNEIGGAPSGSIDR